MAVRVWYDGACPLCQREIALLHKWDKNRAIEFINIAAADSQSLCPIDRAHMLARFHAEENGVLLSGAAAFAAMWRAIPRLKPLGLVARVPFILHALEWLYGKFLRHRPKIIRWLKLEKATVQK